MYLGPVISAIFFLEIPIRWKIRGIDGILLGYC